MQLDLQNLWQILSAGDTPRASSSQGKLKPLNGHTYLSEGKSRSTIQDTLTQQTVSLTDDEGQSAGAEKLVQASLKLSPHNQDAKNSASAAESLVSQGTVDPKSDTAMGAKTSLQTDLLQENSKDTAEPTCSVCLGVLQSLDRSVSEVSEELCNALSESDGAGTSWFPLLTGTPAAIAKHIRYPFAASSTRHYCFHLAYMILWKADTLPYARTWLGCPLSRTKVKFLICHQIVVFAQNFRGRWQ